MATQSSSLAAAAEAQLAGLRPKQPTYVKIWQALSSNPNMLVGLSIILFFGLVAIAAPVITFINPYDLNMTDRLQEPSGEHWFGTDSLGRDLYGLVAYGARISLFVGAAVAVMSSVIGVFIGVTAGYFRWLDDIVMRFMDGLMAIPGILFAIVLMALLGGSLFNVIIAITVVDTPRTARLIRSAVLSIREQMYIDAARAFGAPSWRILYYHVLPNTFAPLIVQATFLFATAILVEASLSFLGAGVPPTTPTWGNTIGEGRTYALTSPWVVFFPGLALFLASMSVNLFGDGLRDKLDPKLRGKG
jgi:peptide/nickel transport system permease protein